MPAYTVAPANRSPRSLWVFLHGILGDRSNWRAIARRVLEDAEGWVAVLVDHRGHGEAHGHTPPHTVAAAAADVIAIERELADRYPDARVTRVLGHSFGGKVAAVYARDRMAQEGVDPLEQLWIVDTALGVRPDRSLATGVERVVAVLAKAPPTFARREDFIDHLEHAGIAPALATWLGKSMRRNADDGLTLVLDLLVIEALLRDYFALDAWSALEAPRGADETFFVVGARSDVVSPSVRERAHAAAARDPHVHVVEIADAGHWVHVDATEAVVTLLRSHR